MTNKVLSLTTACAKGMTNYFRKRRKKFKNEQLRDNFKHGIICLNLMLLLLFQDYYGEGSIQSLLSETSGYLSTERQLRKINDDLQLWLNKEPPKRC